MPVVFRELGFRFHFYSSEGDKREPVHVHCAAPGRDCKLWLYPDVRVAYNRRVDPRTLNALVAIEARRRDEITEAWNEHFA